ncbi:BPTI/Kunitz domain-containing protein [Xanthocytophaga agilis]|uniref:BPTI/Kunitz domain-containing protein n=1 Tax=Xanthocytophaga agilis TaxID=3048010 RepID=A0AAE3UIV7_9BACT|nr:BPTI/Kunitz domain-containing protein [Xanthocytophaga agilis]MDJ1505876.1 BPTI/Kunitz domain-containing protein [Xanthocytophaga agilis]
MRSIGLLLLVVSLSMCKKDCVTSERCQLEPDPGLCYAYMPRYYYDKEEKKCKEFIYGGCGGVVPFETLEACKECECNQTGD